MRTVLMFAAIVAASALRAQVPADVTLEAVPGTTGLDAPLGLKHAGDGSGRLFVIEQGGTVRVIDGTLLDTPFVDITDRVESGGERGLLDIAFHPEFSANGRFYLHYSAGSERPAGTAIGDTIVAEFAVTADPNAADNEPERIVLTVAQDFPNHNGGQMRFGPDGYLYLGLGDGGGANDRCDRAQTLDPAELLEPGEESCPDTAAALDDSRALLGKILRIDVDNPTAAGDNTNLCGVGSGNPAEYSVPSDNPFAGQADRCGEVLLFGLRNPWRWSFDRDTGDIWIGDVGQSDWEEIDLLEQPVSPGENLGWRPCEGSFVRGSRTDPCGLAGSVPPLLEYTHDNNRCSVTGGYRYRGPATSLAGRYIYGDFCTGEIWFADDFSGDWETTLTGFNVGRIRSFGEDADGNVHVIAGASCTASKAN